jgi:hypothetical protein
MENQNGHFGDRFETSGYNVLALTTLRLSDNISSTSPYNDLVFKWNEGSVFSEVERI